MKYPNEKDYYMDDDGDKYIICFGPYYLNQLQKDI